LWSASRLLQPREDPEQEEDRLSALQTFFFLPEYMRQEIELYIPPGDYHPSGAPCKLLQMKNDFRRKGLKYFRHTAPYGEDGFMVCITKFVFTNGTKKGRKI